MALTYAYLDGDRLPEVFSYKPYVPVKRVSRTKTAGAVVTQAASPNIIVHGGDVIPWTCSFNTPEEFKEFWDKYNTSGVTPYTFSGYWGEVLTVDFDSFQPPVVRGRRFDLMGTFNVLAVIQNYNPECTPSIT